MKAAVDYSVVVGVDAHCLSYLSVTVPTWRKFHPQLWDRPWVIFYDGISAGEAIAATGQPKATCFEWLGGGDYANQREKMLSGHVYVSCVVETDYSLKIDCDALAVEPVEFPKAEWFDGRPALAGPGYGYTRAKGGGGTLDEWVERMESFGDRHFGTPRENWSELIGSRDHPKGPKMHCRRFVSWLGFQRTDWVRSVCDLFEADFGPGKLPVPSQDTALWMAAVRAGEQVFQSKHVKRGWTNRVTLRGCREVASGILQE